MQPVVQQLAAATGISEARIWAAREQAGFERLATAAEMNLAGIRHDLDAYGSATAEGFLPPMAAEVAGG
jgi:hypothetical protein